MIDGYLPNRQERVTLLPIQRIFLSVGGWKDTLICALLLWTLDSQVIVVV